MQIATVFMLHLVKINFHENPTKVKHLFISIEKLSDDAIALLLYPRKLPSSILKNTSCATAFQ